MIRDPVHDIIRFEDGEDAIIAQLIDTPEFQRLRHIGQLGVSSFTYPGAVHTRFAHSLGTAHLMKRFIERITSSRNIDADYREELRDSRALALCAALLHDIGHGPFSHAIEGVTAVNHESRTAHILRGDTQIHGILESHASGFAGQVADVILRVHKSSLVVKLVSSQLDVDRSDYLLRDSLMTGAGYGRFDLEWLINTLRIGIVHGKLELGLDLAKGLTMAETLIIARANMYRHVYFHKATRSAEVMIRKIFERVCELVGRGANIDVSPDLRDTLIPDQVEERRGLDSFLALSDHTAWHHFRIWSTSEDQILRELSTRIMDRNLYKVVALPDTQRAIWAHQHSQRKIRETYGEDATGYFLIEDRASSNSYKDAYIEQRTPLSEDGTEPEATEQIFLFDADGTPFELARKSDMINHIRERSIAVARWYAPQWLRDDIESGRGTPRV